MRGLWLTIQVSALSIVLSLLVGVAGAAVRMLKVPVLDKLVVGYVEFIRNTPLLAQLFFIFYGLPGLGLRLSLFWSGVLCLTVWAGAYQIENIRGGLETVGKGLREAAFSLGLSPWRYFRLIAAPMAIRVGLPSMLNTSISLLKNSSYLQAIGLAELTLCRHRPDLDGLPDDRDVRRDLRDLPRAGSHSLLPREPHRIPAQRALPALRGGRWTC